MSKTASFPFRLLAPLAGATALFVLTSTAFVSAGEKVTFGTAGFLSDNSIAIKVAIDKGFYKEVGIDPEVVNFKGGAPAIQALVGNGIQYAIAAPEHAIRLRNRGVNGVIAFALQNAQSYALLVPDASSVKTFADLKGQRVGITSSGSLTESLITLQAKANNLAVGKDIEIIGAGVGAAQKAALDTKRIAAGMFSNTDALQMVGNGYRAVYDWRTEHTPALGLIAIDDWQKKNPELAKGVVQATLKAQQLLLKDRNVRVSTLKVLFPDLPDDVIQKDADLLPKVLVADGIVKQADFDKLQTDLQSIEPDLKPVDYSLVNPATYLN
jgi:NitT/TauT family transport system substrate-binding protein